MFKNALVLLLAIVCLNFFSTEAKECEVSWTELDPPTDHVLVACGLILSLPIFLAPSRARTCRRTVS